VNSFQWQPSALQSELLLPGWTSIFTLVNRHTALLTTFRGFSPHCSKLSYSCTAQKICGTRTGRVEEEEKAQRVPWSHIRLFTLYFSRNQGASFTSILIFLTFHKSRGDGRGPGRGSPSPFAQLFPLLRAQGRHSAPWQLSTSPWPANPPAFMLSAPINSHTEWCHYFASEGLLAQRI